MLSHFLIVNFTKQEMLKFKLIYQEIIIKIFHDFVTYQLESIIVTAQSELFRAPKKRCWYYVTCTSLLLWDSVSFTSVSLTPIHAPGSASLILSSPCSKFP